MDLYALPSSRHPSENRRGAPLPATQPTRPAGVNLFFVLATVMFLIRNLRYEGRNHEQ
jgi:hypothetical protein